jgi:hypothetical protein
MGLFNWFKGNEQDGGHEQTWGDLTEQELNLLNEADWAQEGEPFETPVQITAYPDEGAVYVSDSEGDYQISTTFTYGDSAQADHDLLTALNGGWNG